MANTIKIKRGLSSSLSSLTLQEGEPAITTDTKKLYIGNLDGSKIEIGQQGPRGTKWWVGDFYSEMFTDALDGDLLLNTSDMSPGEVLQFYDGMWNPVANIRGPQGEKGDKGNPGDMAPVGSIYLWGSNTIPEGYLLCNGQAVSRTDYSDLFAVLGTSYGSGDGSSTFNLPDFRSNVPIGVDSSDTNINTLGKEYGEKTHTLTANEMPAHNHNIMRADGGIANQLAWGSNEWDTGMISTSGTNKGSTQTITNTGGSQAHNNMQPSIAMNFIIKAIPTQVVEGQVINSMKSNSEVDAPSIKAVNSAIENNVVGKHIQLTKDGQTDQAIIQSVITRVIWQNQDFNTTNGILIKDGDFVKCTSGTHRVLVNAVLQSVYNSTPDFSSATYVYIRRRNASGNVQEVKTTSCLNNPEISVICSIQEGDSLFIETYMSNRSGRITKSNVWNTFNVILLD